MQTRLPVSLRLALLAFSMIASALLLCVLCFAQGDKPAKPPTSKQKYKNIKVLKDLPADQLIPVMRKINTALGVKCDFCHVVNPDHSGFEKDDKPAKEMARKMILMTQDINKRHKFVTGKVTCFTCHHGHPEPENPPPGP